VLHEVPSRVQHGRFQVAIYLLLLLTALLLHLLNHDCEVALDLLLLAAAPAAASITYCDGRLRALTRAVALGSAAGAAVAAAAAGAAVAAAAAGAGAAAAATPTPKPLLCRTCCCAAPLLLLLLLLLLLAKNRK
jgi:hypothetical protein